MTRNEARNVIVKRLLSAALLPPDKIARPNVEFKIPVTGPWVRISFNDTNSDYRSIGGEEQLVRVERQAVFIIQLFIKQNTGTSDGQTLAESIADLYELQRGDRPIYYDAPTIAEIGNDGEGWYQYNIRVAYDFSVCK